MHSESAFPRLIRSILALLATATSAWLFLWLQWIQPTEGGLVEAATMLTSWWLAGTLAGAGLTVDRSGPASWLYTGAALALASVEFRRGVALWEPEVASLVPVAIVSSTVIAGYFPGRAIGRRLGMGIHRLLLMSVAPVVLVLAANGASSESVKSWWPWSSFQPALLELQANASAAAERLHLPGDRELTKAEQETWSRMAPLTLTLAFPVTGWKIHASAVNSWSDGRMRGRLLWLSWGDGTFGAFDPATMRILSVSD